jgi:hypothetical protein
MRLFLKEWIMTIFKQTTDLFHNAEMDREAKARQQQEMQAKGKRALLNKSRKGQISPIYTFVRRF